MVVKRGHYSKFKPKQNKPLILKRKILSTIFGPYRNEGSRILDNGESEKMTGLNNYVNCQIYWERLKRTSLVDRACIEI